MPAIPSVSVAIEWENVLLAGQTRAAEMLRRVIHQVRTLQLPVCRPVELIVVYDGERTSGRELECAVRGIAGPDDGSASWRFLPMSGGHYYEMKNEAARRSNGDILVFVDSDVLPEPQWLETLLGSFDDPSVSVVGSNVYVDLDGFLSRVLAVTWYFPLRAERPGLVAASSFFANSVAFRRGTFMEFRFDPDRRTSRGACSALARRLHAAGVKIHRQDGARVSHPPPASIIRRALAEGRDSMLGHGAGTVAERFIRGLARSVTLPIADGAAVGLKAPQIPVAVMLAVGYQLVALGGALASAVAPGFMTRRFRV